MNLDALARWPVNLCFVSRIFAFAMAVCGHGTYGAGLGRCCVEVM